MYYVVESSKSFYEACFDLEPVIDAESRNAGWTTAARWDYPDGTDPAITSSTWIAMATSAERLQEATDYVNGDAPQWSEVRKYPNFSGWTDDYGSVLPLVKFWKKQAE